MPDSDRTHRWATQLHRLQQNSLVVWSAILGGVLLATLARWGIGGLVDDRTPFTTYCPAVVVATLLGSFWLGTLTIILLAVVACWIFMPPTFGLSLDEPQITAIFAFILVCLLLVAVVTALKAAVNLLLVEVDQRTKSASRHQAAWFVGGDFG